MWTAADLEVPANKTGENIMEEVMMTIKDVAQFLQISERSAHSFVHNKNFDGLFYIGRSVRISKNKLLDYIQSNLEYRV